MLTDKFLEESGDDVSNDFSTLETLLLIWMGLRLRNLASLEDIEEEYPKWKNKACREFFEYSGTEFQKVKKSSQNKVKSAIKNGIAMTVSNIFSRLKDTDAQTSKKDMLNRSNKNLNKGIKDTQGEIKNLCNISRKCTNKQFIKACDEAYSKIVAGNNADKAIESSIRKLSQKGIEVVGYTDHTTSMDTAVKRAVTSGVNQTSLKFKMDNCKELGINIVKTSSHGGARPSHQEWQGKLFYLHTPVKGLQNFKKATGYGRVDGLGGANCRHSFYEVTDYEYKNNLVDTEEFDKNRNDDQYELEQKQRYYERQIRSWKKRKNILDECGVDSTKEAKKIREWQDKRSQFIKESNIQFKKEHGVDNILKKAYPREKVISAKRSKEEALKVLKKNNFEADSKEFKSFSKVLEHSNLPKSIEEFQNLKYTDVGKWGLLKDYKNSRSKNMISAFTSFEQYVEYKNRIENEIIGLTTSNGLTVQSQSKHFIERVFGTNEDPVKKRPRSGVSLENIKDALIHGKDSIDKKDHTVLRYTSSNCCVTLNKNTGTLIQVNPVSRKRVRK